MKRILILTPVAALLITGVASACVNYTKEVDVCSNIEGNQAVVPEGDIATDGVCEVQPAEVVPVVPSVDVQPAPVTPAPAPVVDTVPPPLTAGK